MELLRLLATMALVVAVMLLAGAAVILDWSRLRLTWEELRNRLVIVAPFLSILGLVLLFNAQFRIAAHDISWVIGLRMTPEIYRLEGATILLVQEFFGELFNPFFSFMYIYGYVFLLIFPLVAYFVLEKLDAFKSLTVAYAANYGIGLVCYIIFVVFGPRNMMPELVGEPLYEHYPHFQLLTNEINQYTNVFPSLHTSLSATVMLFAWKTREQYPRWFLLATFVGTSVIVSTMYLAIHWAVDVLAGLLLALISYWLGVRVVEDRWLKRVRLPQWLKPLRSQ